MTATARRRRSVRRLGLAAAAALLTATWLPTTAQAAALPFTDRNVSGSIGLCDAAGHPVSSGSLLSHPFVTAAGSTAPAPQGYTSAVKAKATLYAFQPRPGVDPGQWSGYQLTGSSNYADESRPLAAGTDIDPSLKDFLSSFPARWNGLVQLRIYYTAPDKLAYRRSYPAAVLRVQGSRWTMVEGARLTCDLTKVVSNERLLLPASAFDPAHPAVTDAPPLSEPSRAVAGSPARTPSAATSPTTQHSAGVPTGQHPAAAGGASTGVSQAALATGRTGDRSTGSGWGPAATVLGLGVAGLVAAFVWRARQRRTR